MILKKTIFILSGSALLLSCSTTPTRSDFSLNSTEDAFITAADENFFDVVSSRKATTRILTINGVETGASRFNRGAGNTKPGLVTLKLRFWGENKRMGFPVGTPPDGKVVTYGCVTFKAEPKKNYTVSTITSENAYTVLINDKSNNSHQFEVPYDNLIQKESTCPIPSTG